MIRNTVSAIAMMLTLGAAMLAEAAEPFRFTKHTINAESKFEACGAGDINADGRMDVMCGDTWYEATGKADAPWKRHHVCDIVYDGNYYHDFANELWDVNGDGRMDVVSCTWHTKEVLWREQPASLDKEWKTHSVEEVGNCETGFFADLNCDELPDFFPQAQQQTVWYELLKRPQDGKFWCRHDVGPSAGHGGGVGDVDGDGDLDIVVREGWYEHGDGSSGASWTWHKEFQLGTASVPILVNDFNRDGLPDIFWGFGHDYGLYWIAQGRDADGKRTWSDVHVVDKSWSQPHTMELADFNGDGVLEVATGKRYFAHNGHDPGGDEPLIICIYAWNETTESFDKHILDQGTKTGFGLHADVADLDADGDLDIIVPGKSGLYWFENRLK